MGKKRKRRPVSGKSKKKNQKKSMLFPKILLGVFVVYAVITIISVHIDIRSEKQVITVLEQEKQEEKTKKDNLNQITTGEPDEDYIRSEAQANDYAAPNERVFIDVAGQ